MSYRLEPVTAPQRGIDRFAGPVALVGMAILAAAFGRLILPFFGGDGPITTWATVFVAIVVQALPFLALGVALSAAVTAFVPVTVWRKALPRSPAMAVPIGVAAGALLPGCECASVPVADRLIRQGVTPAAAIAFLLSAPAINPVVLVSTAVAFPGRPEMVVCRMLASAVTALVVGWCWTRWTGTMWPAAAARQHEHDAAQPRWETFRLTAQHDLFQGGGFLVIGAAVSAILNVAVPPSWIGAAAGVPLIAVLTLAVLAVVLCICSEADAFVAASLSVFPPTAQLAFMVVGPAVDLKLIAMQAGTFGRGFVVRTVPLAWAVAVLASVAAGIVLL